MLPHLGNHQVPIREKGREKEKDGGRANRKEEVRKRGMCGEGEKKGGKGGRGEEEKGRGRKEKGKREQKKLWRENGPFPKRNE